MAKSLAIGMVIGAALGGTFASTIGSAKEQFNSLGREIQGLKANQGLIERFEKDEAALEKARLELDKTRKTVSDLKLALKQNPGDKGLSSELEKARAKADKLSASVEKQRGRLSASRTAMTSAGVAVGGLRDKYLKLGEAIDKAGAKQEKMRARLAAKDAAGSKLGALKGTAVGTIGTVYGAGRLIGQAMDFEHEMRMFGNIANLSNDKLAEIRGQIKDLSAATNQSPGELLIALNDLTAKGLDPGRALASLGSIGKTATASGAAMGDLAATAFTLIDAMGLSPDDLPAAMDMLTQAGKEGSFELEDMAQYFPMLTAQAKSLGLVGKEGIATLGSALQIARKGAPDPSTAANNFQNFLAKVTAPETSDRFFKNYGISIEREMKKAVAAGKNPVEEMVMLINRLTGGDKFRIGELFGDMQVINFLNPMLQNLEEFDRIKKSALSAEGVVDEDFQRMMETGKESLKAVTLAAIRLGEAFGKTLLPAATAVMGAISPMISWASTMIDKYPAVGKLIGYFAIGMGSVAAGIGIATAATWLWNAALLSNPITWVVGGVVAGVAAIITYWTPITTFFSGLWGQLKAEAAAEWGRIVFGLGLAWEGIKATFAAGVAAIVSFWTPISGFFSGLWVTVANVFTGAWDGIVGGLATAWESIKTIFAAGVSFLVEVWERSPIGLLFKAGQEIAGWVGQAFGTSEMQAATNAQPVAPPGSLPQYGGPVNLAAAMPPMAGGGSSTTTISAPITVHAAPGMDEKKLAEQVGLEFDKRAAYGRARQRGALHD